MIALAFAAALMAQDATTTCSSFGGQVTCNSFDNTAGMRAAEEARRDAERRSAAAREVEARLGYIPDCAGRMWLLAGCSRRQHDDAVAGLAKKDAAEALTGEVTRLLAAGDCQGAVKAALEGGDLGLAREARGFCQPTP